LYVCSLAPLKAAAQDLPYPLKPVRRAATRAERTAVAAGGHTITTVATTTMTKTMAAATMITPAGTVTVTTAAPTRIVL